MPSTPKLNNSLNDSLQRKLTQHLHNLEALTDSAETQHAKDVYQGIADCIRSSKPIPKHLQEEYVKLQSFTQNKYGK